MSKRLTVLCADSTCRNRENCMRFRSDPTVALQANGKVRVELSLRDQQSYVCSSYRPINLNFVKEAA